MLALSFLHVFKCLWCFGTPFSLAASCIFVFALHVLALNLTFFPVDIIESMTSVLLACSVNSVPEYLAKPHHSMNAEQLQVSLGSQRKYKIN